MLYAVYSVDMVYTVEMVDTVDTVDTVDAFDTFDTVNTFDTIHTIQTALHCLKSSWADRTGVSEIANLGYVVDGADRADGTDGTDVTEMARMNALFYFDCIGHKEFKNNAHIGL